MLHDVGMKDAAIGDLPQTITAPEFLGSALVRGRAVNMHTIVQSGILSDRHAVVTIEGIPTWIRLDGPDAVKLFQMHVAEGSAIAADSSATTRSGGFSVGVPGLLLGRVGFQWLDMETYGRTWGTVKGESFNLTPDHRPAQAEHERVRGIHRRYGLAGYRDRP